MITYLIILLISFFLDGIMSNYFTSITLHISLFNTIYTVIALSCIANYFSNKKKYIILIGLTGLCFDIVYTNTFLLNVFIFIIIGLNVILLNSKLPNNILYNALISFINVCLYYILTYLILIMTNYININISILLHILICSIIMSIIYSIILTFILNRLSLKNIK